MTLAEAQVGGATSTVREHMPECLVPAELVRLRGEHRIDDTVLRQLQARIDLEELRLTRTELID
jgi:hypothetical protein